MSETESFLERWARRKRDAANNTGPSEASSAPDDQPRAGDVARFGKVETKRAGLPAAAEGEPPPEFDLAKLPSLDSITAESDVRAFLRPGVPAGLTRAALSRAWSADPAIREFVGLAEYDWDFNAEGVAGFGPLEMTEEFRRKITDMVGRNVSSAEPSRSDASPQEQEALSDRDERSGEIGTPSALTYPGVEMAGDDRDESTRGVQPSRNSEDTGSVHPKNIASQHLSDGAATRHAEDVPRRHGRALPT